MIVQLQLQLCSWQQERLEFLLALRPVQLGLILRSTAAQGGCCEGIMLRPLQLRLMLCSAGCLALGRLQGVLPAQSSR